MKRERVNIIFLEGLEPRINVRSAFIGYLFPIGAALKKANLTFKILNVRNIPNYSIQGVIDELHLIDFDALGMSTTADSIRYVYRLCDAIKDSFPDTKIILGGPQVSFSDQETLKNCACDIIIRNEGDYKIVSILKSIGNIKDYKDINGITYKDNNGSIIRNAEEAFVDVNKLPIPLYNILVEEKYWIIPKGMKKESFSNILKKIRDNYNYFMTGRGCPNKCAFCVEGNMKNSYRFKNAEIVKKELQLFLTCTKTSYVCIADDTFTSSPKRVTALCQIFREIQKEHPFTWYCEGRVDILSKHLEMISVMYEAGLRSLQIGIESGNPEVLKIYNKRITLQQMETVIKEAAKYDDLKIYGNIILGNPQETIEQYEESLTYIKHLIKTSKFKLDISTSLLTPFKGTPIRENPSKYGIEILVPNFEFRRLSLSDIVCKPNSLSNSEINSLKLLTEKSFFKFVSDNIYKSSKLKKRILDMAIRTDEKQNTNIWLNKSLIGRSPSFIKYLSLCSRSITVVDIEKVSQHKRYSLIPLRLWDIDYNESLECYLFKSLNNKEILLKKIRATLWEKATGKKNIYQIFNETKTLYEHCEISTVFNVYKYLDNEMAITFLDFGI